MSNREFINDEDAKNFLDGLISDPLEVSTEHALAVVEDEVGTAFDSLREKDKRLYSRKLFAAGYEAGCMIL